mmetsp:Transcript_30514/g.90535  ORF Transcript_30514/g.90535 Transcript_30514/m.90535 type:complete len:318 (+) Transcript_30514:691-1644(+)
MEIHPGVRHPRDARADHVHNAYRESLVLLRDPDRLQSVGRFAALRDRDDDVVLRDDGFPVPELAGVFHLDRDLCQALEGVLGDEAGVPRGAAGADDDPRSRGHALQRAPPIRDLGDLLQAAQLDLPGVLLLGGLVQAPTHRVAERVRLVHDLLEHEVGVAALLDLLQGHVEPHDGVVDGPIVLPRALGQQHRLLRDVVGGHDGVARPLDPHQLPLPEVDHILRVLDDGRGVASQHVLAGADAEDQRGAFPRAYEEVRLVLEEEDDAVGAFDELERARDDLIPVCLGHLQVQVLHEVGQELGVRLALEDVALALQLLL